VNRALGSALLISALSASGCARSRPAANAAADSALAQPAGTAALRADAAALAACGPAEDLLRAWRGARVSVDPAFDLHTMYGGSESRIGCRVLALGTNTAASTSVEAIAQRYRSAGWHEASALDADGPDGSIVGLELGGITCVVEGRWDGGDDSDSTYVPSDSLRLAASCAPTQPRDTL
jgi:hypothetical protein